MSQSSHSPSAYNAMPLEIEFRIRKRFGGWQDAHHAIGVTISGHQLSILSPVKIGPRQLLSISLANENLGLCDIPAHIESVQSRGADFVYQLQFDMDTFSKAAVDSADTILHLLEATLKAARH